MKFFISLPTDKGEGDIFMLRPHLLTDRADFWHEGSILLGLHLTLAFAVFGLP